MPHKVAIVNSTKHSKETYVSERERERERDRTDRAWFRRLLRHPARKQSGSILTTPEPTRRLGDGARI